MGFRAFLRFGLVGALVTGCAALAGLEEPEPTDVDPQEIASPPRTPKDGPAPVDEPTTADAGDAAAPACTATVTPIPSAVARATRWTDAALPAIDGKFDEWACVPRVELGPGDYTSDAYPAVTKASFAMRWTSQVLYIYATVTTESPGYAYGTNYHNDSISIFIGPPGVPTSSSYRTGDHRLTFDHQGLAMHTRDVVEEAWPATVKWKSASVTTDATIVSEHEIAIEPTLLGVAQFEAGKSYLFGLQISDRVNDVAQYRIWYRAPSCGCESQCCYAGSKGHPGCDVRCNGALALE